MKTKSKLKSYSPSNAAACSPVLARVSREFKSWNSDRIIGIVDYYGAVHSRIAQCGDDHNKHFGARMHKCWDFDGGRLYHGLIEEEDREAILRHLKRKYSLRENVQGMARRHGRPPCQDGLSPSPSPSCSGSSELPTNAEK